MSDWLLQAVDPREPVGKEFYLHSAGDWFDIVAVVDHALHPLFLLSQDNPLDYLGERDCLELADYRFLISGGIAAEFLRSGRCLADCA